MRFVIILVSCFLGLMNLSLGREIHELGNENCGLILRIKGSVPMTGSWQLTEGYAQENGDHSTVNKPPLTIKNGYPQIAQIHREQTRANAGQVKKIELIERFTNDCVLSYSIDNRDCRNGLPNLFKGCKFEIVFKHPKSIVLEDPKSPMISLSTRWTLFLSCKEEGKSSKPSVSEGLTIEFSAKGKLTSICDTQNNEVQSPTVRLLKDGREIIVALYLKELCPSELFNLTEVSFERYFKEELESRNLVDQMRFYSDGESGGEIFS